MTEFRRRIRSKTVKPRTRERLEMLRLAHTSRQPRIAEHRQQSPKWVRFRVRHFLP